MHWKRTGEARGAVHWMRLLAAVLSVIAAATVVRATATGRPAPREAQFARITAFFDNEVATRKIPGAVVLLRQHGRPVYLKTFGVRDVATKLPMTPETLFALHSMTKPITSVAAMMLVDQGKMSLDDPIAKYIPAFAHVQVGVEAKDEDGRPVLKRVVPNRRRP